MSDTNFLPLDSGRLRALREERELTQERLADLCKTKKNTVYKWESNAAPNLRRVSFMRLATALNVPWQSLLRQQDVSTPPRGARMSDRKTTIVPRSYPKHNIPQGDCIQFVGRSDELRVLAEKVSPLQTRHFVVQVEGVGGVGKSALIVNFARQLLDSYHETDPAERFEVVVWVSAQQQKLTPHKIIETGHTFGTLHDLFREIAIVLNKREILRLEFDEQRATIRQALVEQRTLLILDNLETIDDDALLAFIRDELPAETKALIASRHTDKVDVAYSIKLKGMPREDALALIDLTAGEKNIELNQTDREALADRTGGVPAAIIWSIGRMTLLPVDSVLTDLRSGKNDITKYCFYKEVDLIRESPAFRLLCALAVFHSDVSREMLGKACRIDEDSRDLGLALLCRLSLVNKANNRFSLSPLTQSYAAVVVEDKLERELQQGRIDVLTEFSEPFQRPRWRNRPRVLLRNEGQALVSLARWCQQVQRSDIYLKVLPALREYFDLVGLWGERIRLSRVGLDYAKVLGDDESIISVKIALAWTLSQQDQHDEARSSIEEASELASRIGHAAWQCESAVINSVVERRQRHYDAALAACTRALGLVHHLSEPDRSFASAWVSYERGINARERGDMQLAERYFLEAQRVLRVDPEGEEEPLFNFEFAWIVHSNIGRIRFLENDLRAAQETLISSLEFFRRVGSRGQVKTMLEWLAELEEKRGDKVKAADYAKQLLSLGMSLQMPKAIAKAKEIMSRLGVF